MRAYIVRAVRGLLLLPLVLGACVWSDANQIPDSATLAVSVALDTAILQAGGLPGRATATPQATAPLALPTAPPTPRVTSPFAFPTSPGDAAPTPARDCTRVFPLDNVESIRFGQTTIAQLEASFGRAVVQSGRAPRFRFEEGGCVLIVTVGADEALDAELPNYGTLGLLLERYGEPAAVGVSQGNLILLYVGSAVLLYPEAGITAVFDAVPDELTLMTPITSLQFRPPYDPDQQMRRLNLRPVPDWKRPSGRLPR